MSADLSASLSHRLSHERRLELERGPMREGDHASFEARLVAIRLVHVAELDVRRGTCSRRRRPG